MQRKASYFFVAVLFLRGGWVQESRYRGREVSGNPFAKGEMTIYNWRTRGGIDAQRINGSKILRENKIIHSFFNPS
jgi:hypothetical protein